MYSDISGYWLDTVIDIASIGWSFWDFINDPTWANAGWLALDIIFAAVPFLTGSKVIKLSSKSDEIVDVLKYTNKIDNFGDAIVIGNGMDNVIYAANKLDALHYAGYAPLNALSDAGRISDATFGMKFMGRFDNSKWLMSNLLKGYNVIDIGSNRSFLKFAISAYGMERGILFTVRHGGQIMTRGARMIW
jgi:hypothetical protein